MTTADDRLNYLDFVVERHRIWEARRRGEAGPWTTDPILAGRKFTNVFRVLDPGSQFIFELDDAEADEREVLMRCFLYRHTGRIEAWRHLQVDLGGFPTVAELDAVASSWREYRGELKFRQKNTKPYAERANKAGGFPASKGERPIFTGAYLVFPQSQVRGTDKVTSILDLTRRLFTPGSPSDVMPAWLGAKTQAERFAALRSRPGVGDFMAMQVLTDWGYTRFGEDRENDFVVAGPGAVKGATALGFARASVAIDWAHSTLTSLDECPTLLLPRGASRQPSYMDVQNTLCEWSKHVRLQRDPKGLRPYKPAHPGPQAAPVLPAHW